MAIQWPLVIFTLFVTLGAGVLFALGILGAAGKDKEVRFPALAVALGAIVVGGIASAFHLQHMERIFNGFGKLSSGITQELIFIVVAFAAIVLYFAMARKGDTPKWVGIVAIVAGLALAFFCSHSYSMAARPAWDNFFMYAFYMGGAFLLGTVTVLGLQGLVGAESGLMAKLAVVAGALQTIIVAGYSFFVGSLGGSYHDIELYFDSTEPTKAILDAGNAVTSYMGENGLLFWGGAVALGAVIPLVLSALCLKKQGKPVAVLAFAALACALVGGIIFRVVLYNLGFATFVLF